MSSRISFLLRRLNAHPRSRDAVVAVLYLLLGLALLQFGGYRIWVAAAHVPATAPWSTDGLFLLLLIAMTALATARSTRPFLVLTISVPLAAVDAMFGSSLGVVILFADFVYCAFRYGTDRGVRVLLQSIIATCAVVGALLLLWPNDGARFATTALQWALIVLIAALWGWNVRSERQRTRSAMEEEHLVSTQRLREHIAHELHDLVANQIAVAGLNIEAARLRMATVEAASDEIDESLVRATRGTQDAHSELRRLIAVLTTVDEVVEASGSDSRPRDLDGMLPVGRTLIRDGTDLEGVLAAMPSRSAGLAMRAVQELVMNAVKHGRGDIVLTVDDTDTNADPITVRVSNQIASTDTPTAGSGIGISGATMLLNGIGGSIESAAEDDRWSATLMISEEQHG